MPAEDSAISNIYLDQKRSSKNLEIHKILTQILVFSSFCRLAYRNYY